MRWPRMTTRRWMVVVAVAAVAMFFVVKARPYPRRSLGTIFTFPRPNDMEWSDGSYTWLEPNDPYPADRRLYLRGYVAVVDWSDGSKSWHIDLREP